MGLVERDTELAAIVEHIAATKRRDGRCLVVEGAAGLGKSSLLGEAARVARADGLTVLSAHGGELERDLAYSTVSQLFDRMLHRASPAFRAEVLAGAAAHAASLFGFAPGPVNPAAVDYALYWLVSNLAEHGPLALVVDDAHWMDEASLRALRYLAPRITDLPVLILVATRDPGLFVVARTDALTLVPLSERGVGAVLAIAFNPAIADELRAECVRLTGGNPFLVTEFVANLRHSHPPTSDGAGAWLHSMTPDAIVRSVLGRIAKVGPAAMRLAQAVAVLGPQAHPREVAGLAGTSEPDTRNTVELLRVEGILVWVGADVIGFAHPVLRSVVYDDMGIGLRSAEHRRAADLLASQGVPLSSWTPHLLLAAPSGDLDTVTQLVEAASAAMASAAPETAVHCLQRALAEPAPTGSRVSIQRSLGAALSGASRVGEAVQAYQEALAASGPDLRIDISVELGWLLMMIGRGDQAALVLRDVTADQEFTELQPGMQAALSVAGLVAMDNPGTWARTLDRIEQLPPSGPDRQLLLANHAFAATTSGDRPARAVVAIVEDLLREPIARECRFMVVNSICPALTISDDAYAALRVLDRAIEEVRDEGDGACWRYFAAMRARIAPEVGDLVGAEADARLVLELERNEATPVVPIAAAMLVEVLLDRGNVDGAAELDAELSIAGQGGVMEHFVRLARGRLRRHQRRYAEALDDLQESGRLLTEHGYHNPGFLLWRTETALAYLDAGDLNAADQMAREHIRLAMRTGAARSIGIGLWVLALTDTGDDRIALLHEADEILADSNTQLPRLRVRVDLGIALRRRGKRAEATSLLEDAYDTARRFRADGLAQRAFDELATAGSAPRATGRTGPDALTASELRVARFAASGLTNRQIAQELFVSRRTVELHLTNVFRKLGIDQRDRITEILQDP